MLLNNFIFSHIYNIPIPNLVPFLYNEGHKINTYEK
jgi:hypothetical protein